jgi:hypothetical protein
MHFFEFLNAFSASAITLGIWEGIFGRVTELPEQHYERLLYIRKFYGATRTEELKVQYNYLVVFSVALIHGR